MNGPQFTAGKIGQAMWLPGVRDYMSLNPATLTELDFGSTLGGDAVDFSAAMWIRQDNFLSDPAVFSNKDWDNGDNTGINWAVKGNGIFDLNTKGDVGVAPRPGHGRQQRAADGRRLESRGDDRRPRRRHAVVHQWRQHGDDPRSRRTAISMAALPWNVGQDGTGQYGVEFTGAVDELAIWRRALSAAEAGQLWNGGAGINLGDQVVELRLKLVIDRDSGRDDDRKQHRRSAGPSSAIRSLPPRARFNRPAWTPIAGRLDDAGNGTIDADDNWVVLTAPESKTDLSEVSFGTGTIPAGAKVRLGAGVWRKVLPG